MATRRRTKLFKQIDQEVQAEITAHRQVDQAAVAQRVWTWAKANPEDVLDGQQEVLEAVRTYVENRRPRVGTGQLGFFDTDALMPVTEGVCVPMGKLTNVEFDAWWQIETQEHLTHVRTYATKGVYYSERRPLLVDGLTLEDIEVAHFGWRP